MKEKFRYYVTGPLSDIFLFMALVIFGRTIKIAKSWNQLNEAQLCSLATALDSYHRLREKETEETKYINYSRLYLCLIKNLLRTNNFGKVLIALKQIPPEEYKDHVKFLFEEVTRTKFLPAFKLKGKLYFPPGDRLQNITIKEFSFADSLYYNWRKSNDDRYLDMLCATLYRQGDYKWLLSSLPKNEIDIRKNFNKVFIEKDAPVFKKLSKKKKLAIAFTYEGCRNYVVKQYPHVFPEPPREEKKKMKKSRQSYTPFGKLLHFKIQFDHSKLEAVQSLNIHDFFGPYENELIEMKNKK